MQRLLLVMMAILSMSLDLSFGKHLVSEEVEDDEFQNIPFVENEKRTDETSKKKNVIEGDILVSKFVEEVISGGKSKRFVLHGDQFMWKDRKYYYQISDTLSSDKQKEVREALKYMAKVSCIEFIEGTSNDGYVLFQKSKNNNCNSYVGRTGDTPQVINVPDWCRDGNLKHEIMHSLGFFHEQNRQDRDNYVTIHTDNMIPGTEDEFKKYTHPAASTFNKPYDYASIMHYDKYAFSKNGKATIEPKKAFVSIGKKKYLSKDDIKLLNKLYGCKKCKNSSWICPLKSIFSKCTRSSKCLGSCGFWCKA